MPLNIVAVIFSSVPQNHLLPALLEDKISRALAKDRSSIVKKHFYYAHSEDGYSLQAHDAVRQLRYEGYLKRIEENK